MKNFFRRFNYKLLTLLSTSALTLLMVISFFGHHKLRKGEESSRWVSHTLEAIASLVSINSSIFKIANAQKYYIISRNPSYQHDFNHSLEEHNLHENKLRTLIGDNPEQLKSLNRSEKKVLALLDYYRKTIQLVDQGKQDEAIKLVSSGLGNKLLEEVSLEFERMESLEKKLLDDRLAEERNARLTANNYLFFSMLGGILTVLAFIFLTYRENIRRERAQRELNRNSQVQKAILQAAAYALIATDEEGRISHFNPAAQKLLGYSEEEMLGKSPALFHDPIEVAKEAEELTELLQERVPVGFDVFAKRAQRGIAESRQWTYIRKDNTRVQVSLTITPLTDIDGEISGYLAIGNDISKRLETEVALTTAKEDALAGTRAKSEFLANMSHEIRTPMNAILGMAELLNETNLDDEQRKYVRIFQSAGSGLLNIINDILDLSKIESGHFELNLSSMSLPEVISQATEIMAIKAHQKDLELIVDQDADLPDHYLGDGPRLRQIILNLLGNAVKFTRKGEIILKISSGALCDDGSQEIDIEVRDTGIGMTEEQLKKIFQRFSQADSSITKEFGGTGLGLNITLKLVELMDGKIEAQSTYGIGTRFIVQIKLKPQTSPESEEQRISLKGLKFLVVDDNKTNRLIVRKILERQGSQVTEADSGESAWEIIQSHKTNFDLMLIDGRMPKIDGFTLAERILNEDKGKEALLMMLTSDNRPGDLARSRDLGIKSLLVKPILKDELLNAIDKVLGQAISSKPQLQNSDNTRSLSPDLSLLLVDDNDENRLVIKAFLKNTNIQINEAKNGEEALKLFSERPYQLVFMDMQMPVMDGYSAVKEIRKLEFQEQKVYTPIVALSAFALKEEIDRSYLVGCNAHLTKPVSKKDILEMIRIKTSPVIEEIPSDMQDILPDYLAGRKDETIILTEALFKKDFKTLQFIGHKLAGAAGSYGLMKLTEIGQRLESSARSEDLVSLSMAVADYRLYLRQLEIIYLQEK